MDSVTHIVIGATIGEIILGKKIGNKAMLIGALANTIPDFDVFFAKIIGNSDSYLRYHRAETHALFYQLLYAIPIAYLFYNLFKKKVQFSNWYSFFIVGFFTHSFMDCFTTYGTRLFLPFSTYLVGLNNLSIVDPIYTVPFILLLLSYFIFKRSNPLRLQLSWGVISFALLYLCLTFFDKYTAHKKFESQLQKQQLSYTTLSTSPTILNNILWAGIAYNDTTLYVGEYSLWQKNDSIHFVPYQRNIDLANNFPAKKQVQLLQWFSQDKYFIQQPSPDSLNFFITKWGRGNMDCTNPKEAFFMYYTIFKNGNNWEIAEVNKNFKLDFKKELKKLYGRIINGSSKN